MDLKQTLIHVRKQHGLSQIELAEALNVSRQTISKWETGTALPSAENLLALSNLYGISADALLKGLDPEPLAVSLLPDPVCLPEPAPPRTPWQPLLRRILAAVFLFDLLLFLLTFYLSILVGDLDGLCSLLRILGCCLIGLAFAHQQRNHTVNPKVTLILFLAVLTLALYVFFLPVPLLWRLYDLTAWIGSAPEALIPSNPVFFFLGWTLFDSFAASAHLFLAAAFLLGRLWSSRTAALRVQPL